MYRVLLVDDEPWALAGLCNTFPWHALGYEIIGKTMDPREAYKLAVESHPDVVISDIRMPEMSGLDLLKAVRAAGINSEWIVVSGFDDFKSAQTAIRHGVFAYLSKPLDAEEGKDILSQLALHIAQKEHQRKVYNEWLKLHHESDDKDSGNTVEKVLQYMMMNYHEDISLESLASRYYISASNLAEQFKQYTGMTLKKYLITLRMRRAREILLHTSKSIDAISKDVGYRDYFYFIKAYKQFYGVTPYQDRKRGDDK